MKLHGYLVRRNGKEGNTPGGIVPLTEVGRLRVSRANSGKWRLTSCPRNHHHRTVPLSQVLARIDDTIVIAATTNKAWTGRVVES